MQTAQRLYEGVDIGGETTGLITYMRTDGISMVGEAISECRATITSEYGDDYLPDQHRVYKSKAKNAQEAHEAIRPTSFTRTPASLKLSGDMKKLYELIWKRAMSSQMASAKLERTTITIEDDAKTVGLRATGQVVRFDGFLKLYEETKQKAKGSRSTFHTTAAALFRSQPRKTHGRARYWPSIDIRLYPQGSTRPWLCRTRQAPLYPFRQRPFADSFPRKLLPEICPI